MALSRVTYIGNGTTQTYSLTFNYLNKSHVKAFINGVEDTGFTFPTTSTITLTSVPPNGALVLLQRVTPTTPIVDFVDGSNLTEVMLDTATTQAIYIAEENKDDAASALVLDPLTNTYTANNKRIGNVADPVNPQDVTTKTYVDSTTATSATNAANSAISAANSANIATTKANETEADRVQTGLDRTQTGLDVIATQEAVVSALIKGNNLSDLTSASTARTNLGLVIGTDVQGYDVDTAKTDVLQTFTASQRGTITTDNDLSFDMSVTNNFTCTPTAGGVLTFTNITAGQSGYILLTNNSNYAITAAASTKVGAAFLANISLTGTYLISYFSNGTNVYCTSSGVLA